MKTLYSILFLLNSIVLSAQTPQEVFVVNTQDSTVSLIDITGKKEIHRFKVGAKPYGISVSLDNKTVAVGVEGEMKMKFYDTETFMLKGEASIGRMHNDHITLSPDGKYFLDANFYSDEVVAIDAATLKEVFRIPGASAPHVIKIGPSNKYAYITCKKVTGIAKIDLSNYMVVKFYQVNVNPRSLTFSPDEKKLYFGSFWVNGFFEMDIESGKVTRLFELTPPEGNTAPQEVTYHGVENVFTNIVLAANEGRSCIDAVDINTGKLLSRLTADVNKPCCVEKIPGDGNNIRALVSNIGDGSITLIEVTPQGKISSLGKIIVGAAPKRVAFLYN
jgi:YVTN family beta-propeller protein